MDKNISPVGWYVGTYLLRFIEMADKNKHDPDKRFVTWENTVLVKGLSLDEAYDKIENMAKSREKPYNGGETGVAVQWEYMGIIDLLPIYEALDDGAEIMWAERSPRTLKRLQSMVKQKKDFLRYKQLDKL